MSASLFSVLFSGVTITSEEVEKFLLFSPTLAIGEIGFSFPSKDDIASWNELSVSIIVTLNCVPRDHSSSSCSKDSSDR